jgi:gliding motility-associated-like protein
VKQSTANVKQSFFYMALMIVLMLVCTNASAQYVINHSSTCAAKPIIFNSTVFETAPFPDSAKWNFGDPASGIYNTANGIQEPIHIFNNPGTYYVQLRVVDPGLGTVVITDTIIIVNQVTHNFGPDVFLCGDTSTYQLTAPVIAGAAYMWNDDSSTIGPMLTVTESGTYTVLINGCAVSDTVGVFFSKIPQLDLGRNHTLCSGEKLTLTAASENASYTWYLNGVQLPETTEQIAVAAPGGTYVAALDVPGCGNYRDTVAIGFSNYAAPPFSLGPDTLLCPKEILTLIAHVPNATAWSWSSRGLDVDDAVRYDIDLDSSISITQRGRYWAFVTVAGQCEVVDTMIVRYRNNKELNFNDTALCQGNTLLLDADFGTGQYEWKSEPVQRNDQDSTNQSTYYVYNAAFITLTARVGHCVYKDSLHVYFNDSLQLSLGRDTTLCRGESYTITPVTNTNNYTWQDGSQFATYTPTRSGTYSVVAQNGCGADTATVAILFEDCPCALLLPNAFTPNGDGRNDNFRPLHACDMEQYTMRIFNRYGEMVFVSRDPLQPWNGRKSGKPVPNGAYVWMVDYIKTSNQQAVSKKGSVLVLN